MSGRGNDMRDHSRFQRDIDDVTGVSLSLSVLLTKVTQAQFRTRFRTSYNASQKFMARQRICISQRLQVCTNSMLSKGRVSPAYESLVRTKYSGFTVY